MHSFQIEKVTPREIEIVRSIGITTFTETFAGMNSEENMLQYLNHAFSFEKLSDELKDKHAEFYIAYQNKTPVGYLKINLGKSQTVLKDEKALEIERIYVLKEFHGKKIGQLLFQKALETAENKNVSFVWLGVWEKNDRAIGFYRKNNFVEFDKHIFKLGDDEQTDIMMKLELNKD